MKSVLEVGFLEAFGLEVAFLVGLAVGFLGTLEVGFLGNAEISFWTLFFWKVRSWVFGKLG
jgi:hypothetical protein